MGQRNAEKEKEKKNKKREICGLYKKRSKRSVKISFQVKQKLWYIQVDRQVMKGNNKIVK